MRIIDLPADNQSMVEEVAELLIAGFKDLAPHSWPDLESALAEVRESLAPGRISRVALEDAPPPKGSPGSPAPVAGWIGAIRSYDGHAWELHPLVVRPGRQGRGVGRALVADLEAQVRAQGATTIYLGTDDEDNRTSLGGADLYPNVLEKLAGIQNPGRHPYGFYLRLGYVVVGAIPDANGPGKPDILMAKRIS